MIHYAVIGCPERQEQAERLTAELHATLFLDTDHAGATATHTRALRWGAEQTGHLVVLEDDAIPVPMFKAHTARWITQHPDDLISFYLGTGRPPQWMARVDRLLPTATDHIRLPQLIHGVCYTIPCHLIPDGIRANQRADYAIGSAWFRATGRQVVYPIRSLVEHADGPSIANPNRSGERHARYLAL